MPYLSTTKRTLLKTITFRIIVIITDTVIIFAITRRLDVTGGLVLSTNIVRTILYFFHERAWNNISWGRT